MPLEPTPTRRQLIGSAFGLAGALVAGGTAAALTSTGQVSALGSSVAGPAEALDQAERLGITDKLTFPVDNSAEYGSLVCLNNFRGYSTANGPCGHMGVDIGNDEVAGEGRPLLACVDGIIAKDEAFSSAGNTRILRDALGTYYRYHHLDEYAPGLEEGDAVVAGQVIGTMGATGNTSWSHLHFEIWLGSLNPADATIIDPVPRLPFPTDNVTLNASTACEL